ncbi:MAG: alpha-L-fucosidase [Bacteroidales bacterium]
MKLVKVLLGIAIALMVTQSAFAQASGLCDISSPENEPLPVFPVPKEKVMAWHKTEFYAFMHFGINTFTNKEWGYGDENINTFNPTSPLNVRQWVTELKDMGVKGIILTCKHHDGFCTWFTESTNHSTKNNTTANGHVDIPKMLSDECKKQGLKFGAYISPWDRNNAEYARAGYVKTFHQQIREICTNYGELFEMWFDGANGGDGYYGGARESRSIDASIYYDFPKIFKMINDLQPNCAIWGNEDCRWVGNEEGWAGETSWCTFGNGSKGSEYGDEDGWRWFPSECDAKNGPGWFWSTSSDSNVKSGQQLFNIYMTSVGRNSNLVLNIPPNKAGELPPSTIAKMREFKALMDAAFGTDLALRKTAEASAERTSSIQGKFAASNVTDDNDDTYWALEDGTTSGTIDIDLGGNKTVKYVSLSEYIRKGQRVKGFEIYTWNGSSWAKQATTEATTTIGYKRIIKLTSPISTSKVRVKITDSKVCPLISRISIY